MKFKKVIMFVLIGFIAAALAACGGNDAEENNTDSTAGETETENTAADQPGVNGEVLIDGSGTVYPLMKLLSDEFMNDNQNVFVEVSRAGTSGGFERFLEDNGTDFNNASRKIKDEELAAAEELGFEVKELKVALDGLTVVIHPDNEFANEMTPEEIVSIFLGDYTTWSDVNPDWPDEVINTYGPNENHGTYEFFYENILEEQELREDVNLHQEYPELVKMIGEDANSIGFFGFGYYLDNEDSLKAVSIDFGNGPVAPTLDTIAEDGEYAAFTRPVFTYLNINHAEEKPEVLDFAIYIMKEARNLAGEAGFAPIPDEEADALVNELEALK